MQQGQTGNATREEKIKEEKPAPLVEHVKEDQEAGWPSFGQLVGDLSKLAFEALGGTLLPLVPFRFVRNSKRNNLTPLKDSLIMPEDEAVPPLAQKQRAPVPTLETRQAYPPNASEVKPPKVRSSSLKDPSLSTKHRSSRRQEFAEYYGSGEIPPVQVRSKSQKERTKHRQRDKSGEVVYGTSGMESKPVESKPVNYDHSKYDQYNPRSKCGDAFRFE